MPNGHPRDAGQAAHPARVVRVHRARVGVGRAVGSPRSRVERASDEVPRAGGVVARHIVGLVPARANRDRVLRLALVVGEPEVVCADRTKRNDVVPSASGRVVVVNPDPATHRQVGDRGREPRRADQASRVTGDIDGHLPANLNSQQHRKGRRSRETSRANEFLAACVQPNRHL